MSISHKTADHFDFVIDGQHISKLPNSPDRWPDKGNGADKDPDDPPPTKIIPTSTVFIATQPSVSEYSVERYVNDLRNGASMPPIAGIKTPDGVIVWNGHHRLAAHRLAGRKTIKVRFWAEIDHSVEGWKEERHDRY